MRLSPNERLLTGKWVRVGDQIVADAVCRRIEMLVTTHLQKLANDEAGWSTLYEDPGDGRLWVLTYPESDGHGGGPPELSVIEAVDARVKFPGLSRA